MSRLPCLLTLLIACSDPAGPLTSARSALQTGPATLVSDLVPGVDASQAAPYSLVVSGGRMFFVADSPAVNGELWVTDGTTAGTGLVRDIRPSTRFQWGSAPERLTDVAGTLFFTAETDRGRELWKSDGTAAGTVLVKDIRPGPLSSEIDDLIAVGGLVYFTADDGVSGIELWRSDGSSEGTERVADLVPGSGSAYPGGFEAVGSTLFFGAFGPGVGWELYKVDSGGVALVRDIRPGAEGSSAMLATAVGGELFFFADDGVHGAELWKSDGSSDGTVLVRDLEPGAAGVQPGPVYPFTTAAVGNRLLFSADGGSEGRELWASDGTSAGTVLVADIFPGPEGSAPGRMVAHQGVVYFEAFVDTLGSELWRSDGTLAGTRVLRDIAAGTFSSNPGGVLPHQGALYFQAAGALWRSDGTSEGTVMLADVWPERMAGLGDSVYFTADRELWRSDGTSDGTGVLKLARDPRGSWPNELTFMNGMLYFTATAQYALWKTDGTSDGTVGVPTAPLTGMTALAELDGTLLFHAGGDPWLGVELYRSDGSSVSLVRDIAPSWDDSYPGVFTRLGSEFLFSADDKVHGRELWASDGTSAGTVLVRDIKPGGGDSYPYPLVPMGGSVYFFAENAAGRELWKSDGSSAGTGMVRDLVPGALYGDAYGLSAVGGRLFFLHNDAAPGLALWKSDGTSDGTVRVADVPGFTGGFERIQIAGVGGEAFFGADDGVHGWELWKSDGSSAGTLMVADLWPGALGSEPEFLVPLGGALLFSADDGMSRKLWRTDGTTTEMVAEVELVDARPLVLDGRMLFAGADAEAGAELWVSDGTAAGTWMVQDIASGPAPSGIRWLTAAGEQVFFVADDGVHGTELWVLAVSALGARPLFITCPAGVAGEATGPAGAVMTYPAASAQGDSVSYSHASGSVFALGATSVTATASDGSSSTASCSFVVTVRDTTPPALTCPASAAAEATSASGAAVSFAAPSATDLVAGALTPGLSHASGSTFPLGTTIVTASAADGASNTGACSFTVTVGDTTPPAITCPGDQSAQAAGVGVTVNYPAPTATDLVTAPAITVSHASGATFPVGSTQVSALATDGAGNSAGCTFAVNVAAPASGPAPQPRGRPDGCGCAGAAGHGWWVALAVLLWRRRRAGASAS